MPLDVLDLGLKTAIENLFSNNFNYNSVETSCQIYLDNSPLKEEIQLNLFRIIQEILKNIIQHANAKKVLLQLSYNSDYIHLEVENDGNLFDVAKALKQNKGIGLKNIHNRVKLLNGEINITSDSKFGTIFSILIPV